MTVLPRATTLFLCAWLAIALGASRAETSPERGKRVVDEALQALGGKNFLEMQDRIESGRAYSFYRGELNGLSLAKIYTRYLIRPEPPVAGFFGIRERQNFGKKEDSGVIFSDGKGYEITFRGARPLPDATVERHKETTLRNVFYILRQRLGEPGLLIESRGADVVSNQPVEVVDFIDSDNRQVTVYFHQTTKLPLRQKTTRREPGNEYPIEEITIYSKYRDVGGGVMWPFAIQRLRDGEKIFEIYSDSVTINQDLTDNIFFLAEDMKLLKPMKK